MVLAFLKATIAIEEITESKYLPVIHFYHKRFQPA